MNTDVCRQYIMQYAIEPMLRFVREWGEEEFYTEDDVSAVKALLESYVEALSALKDPTDEQIMEQVRDVVLALNRLNQNREYPMIETEEREMLWEAIQNCAEECGLKNAPYDVTEEWREW